MFKKVSFYFSSFFVLLLSIFLGYILFLPSYYRLFESLQDFIFEFLYLIEISIGDVFNNDSTIIYPSKYLDCDFLSIDFVNFKLNIKKYFILLFNSSNFLSYLYNFFNCILTFFEFFIMFSPVIILFVFVFKKMNSKVNTNYNVDSMPLKVFKRIERIFVKVKKFLLEFIEFFISSKIVFYLFCFIWLLNLNLISIILEFIAFYLYFIFTYDFENLYIQFYKLCADLQFVFKPYVFPFILPFIFKLFNSFRINIAVNKLEHLEAKNCGFINSLPIVTMTCGSMGKKKTTIITDMVLSQEVMFRQKALKIMIDNDLKFPNFPFILLENDLQKQILKGKIKNLVDCKNFILNKKEKFFKRKNYKTCLYGYEKNYPLKFNNGLFDQDIFDCLSIYCQAYFIYILSSSLIISNYSIRTDNTLFSYGNLPIWNYDFFSDIERDSRYSHILDFDLVRLGKKVLTESNSTFELGVVGITEVGKERGNSVELQGVKKSDEKSNQKNDLFNQWLKMCRHSSTVDFFPFVKVFADEQRPESWGADAKDLADILTIKDNSELKISLPFFIYEEIVIDFILSSFKKYYVNFRYKRGDNTLFSYLFKKVAFILFRRQTIVFNKFGYSISKILRQQGPCENDLEEKKYYLCNKKIYSNRFSTDCFNEYFSDKIKNNSKNLVSLDSYENEKASVSELRKQNSYFIRSLYGECDSD